MSSYKLLYSALLIVGLGAGTSLTLIGEEAAPKAKEEKHDAMKEGTVGVSVGEIVSKEKGKMTLHTKDGDLLFMAHWKGGNPKDGGGLDAEMLTKLEQFKPGQQVKIGWIWQERRRIERIEALK